jgi:phosphoenolpyruvate carboxylase
MTDDDTVTLTIVPRLDPFIATMAELEEIGHAFDPFRAAMDNVMRVTFQSAVQMAALYDQLVTAPARRSAMHAAYRAKTRRRNRR